MEKNEPLAEQKREDLPTSRLMNLRSKLRSRGGKNHGSVDEAQHDEPPRGEDQLDENSLP